MTTIAYKDGILASDSRLSEFTSITTDKCEKLYRLPDGSLYAFAGDNEPGMLMLDALMKDKRSAKLPEDCEFIAVLIVYPKGQIYFNESGRWCRWPERYIAIGSGGQH